MAVLIIPGLRWSVHDYRALMKRLQRDGKQDVHVFRYDDRFGKRTIEHMTEELSDFVESLSLDKKNELIGLSMGGIIAAHYLEDCGGKARFQKCITICTPFYGSILANVASFSPSFFGIEQLRPTSSFLKGLRFRIDNSNVKYYGVWNPLDLMVFPGKNAFGTFMHGSRRVRSILHFTTFWDKKTLDFVSDVVNRK